jgi:uncharacterized membrane protein
MDANQNPDYGAVPTPPPAASTALADNVAGALAYVTIIPAILFLVLEPYNKRPFVRYNCFQCLALSVVWICFSIIWVIPILGWILGFIGMITLFCTWIFCIVKAYSGVKFKLPIIGEFVEKLAAS